MSADQTLKALRKSLEPKPKPEPSKIKPSEKAVTIADALLKIPELTKQLRLLSEQKKREVDNIKLITQLDFDIKMLTNQTNTNLAQINKLTKQVTTRIEQFNLIEQKWNNLINRVDDVLQELERILKNY